MESPDGFDEEASDYDDVPLSTSTGNKRARKGGSGRAKGKTQSKKDDDGNDAASVRKLQNRTAQREFRQRKLQYVKDLEARVEFLSSPKDDQLEILKALLHGFIEENKQLRALLQSVTGFIGSGIGGRATELGFNRDEDLEDFVKRSDRDTLHQLYEEFQAKLKEPHGGAASHHPNTTPTEVKTESVDGSKRNAGSRQTSARSSPVHTAGPSTTSNAIGSSGSAADMARRKSSDGPAASSSRSAGVKKQSPPQVPQSQSHAPQSAPPFSSWTSRPFDGLGPQGAGGQYNPPPPPNQQSVPNGSSYGYNNFAAQNVGPSTSNSHSSPLYSFIDNARGPLSTSQSSSSLPVNPYASAQTPSSSSFFFDTADPMSMPMSAFTSDFLSEFISTGFTPLFETSNAGGGYNWNVVDHATPSSSTSSQNNYAPSGSTTQNVNDAMNSSRNITLQQREEFTNTIVNKITASHRKRFNLPQGLTPADIISNSPMLSLCYMLSGHMRNKAANPNYVLPEVLQPTPLQIATPHDFRIDGILSKPFRDALIVDNEYNFDELFSDVIDSITVHPGEPLLDPINLEYPEALIRKYRNVMTPDIIATANYWRRTRGEPDLTL